MESGRVISTEVLIGILGIAGIIFGAWGTRVKNRSQQELVEAQSALFAAEGQLTQVKADAEVRIAEAKIDAEERTFIREQFKNQITLNEQFPKMMAEIDARNRAENESNYRSVRNVQNDTNTVLVNILNALNKQHAIQIEALGAMPGAIQAANVDTLREFARQLATDMGTVMVQQFAIQSLDRELFPFPDPEDPSWREEWVAPLTPEPTIHKQPYFNDAVKLQKPCAQIKPEGELVRIIRNRIKGWLIVKKFQNDDDCWGWLPEHTVQIVPQTASALGVS